MWEKQLCRHQGQWRRRGRRCSRHRSRDSPAACGEDHGEASCPPAADGGPWWSRYPPAAREGSHAGAGGCAWRRLRPRGEPVLEQAPSRTCGPMERGAYAGAGLLAGPVTPWGTYTGAVCPWRAAAHGKDLHWRSSWRTVCCGRDPMMEQGKRVRRKEQQKQCVMNWPQAPFPVSLHRFGWGGGRVEKIRSQVKPGKKGGVGGRCFKI